MALSVSSQRASQPASQSASETASRPAGQSAGRPAGQSVVRSGRLAVGPSDGRARQVLFALDGLKNSISAIATCLLPDAMYEDSMVKRTLVTSPTRKERDWAPALW